MGAHGHYTDNHNVEFLSLLTSDHIYIQEALSQLKYSLCKTANDF